MISDAAKQVKVESHVLRYWEEELHLPIKRNELGHRYYTKEDVERFKEIKSMKERGLQLKAIKMILKDGRLVHTSQSTYTGKAFVNIFHFQYCVIVQKFHPLICNYSEPCKYHEMFFECWHS